MRLLAVLNEAEYRTTSRPKNADGSVMDCFPSPLSMGDIMQLRSFGVFRKNSGKERFVSIVREGDAELPHSPEVPTSPCHREHCCC